MSSSVRAVHSPLEGPLSNGGSGINVVNNIVEFSGPSTAVSRRAFWTSLRSGYPLTGRSPSKKPLDFISCHRVFLI